MRQSKNSNAHIKRAKLKIPSKGDRTGASVWIKGALEIIAKEGVGAVKIEKLARAIGISKGSFYWFFQDLDDILTRSLDHWRHDYNNTVFDHIRSAEGDTETRLHLLIDMVFRKGLGRYDSAIRAWALQDPRVRQCMEEVDGERIELLTTIFVQGGSAQSKGELHAHLFYRAFIAESFVKTYPTGQDRKTYMRELAGYLANPAISGG